MTTREQILMFSQCLYYNISQNDKRNIKLVYDLICCVMLRYQIGKTSAVGSSLKCLHIVFCSIVLSVFLSYLMCSGNLGISQWLCYYHICDNNFSGVPFLGVCSDAAACDDGGCRES